MKTNLFDGFRTKKVFFLLSISLLISACSTGEMEFSVGEQALKESPNQAQLTESPKFKPR